MKKVSVSLIFLFALCGMLLFDSCSKKDDPAPTPLTANAGPDQTVAPFATVTLDGSASGPAVTYEWIFSNGPDSEVNFNFQNRNVVEASFEPKINGIYLFTLRLTNGSEFAEDQVQITVTGAIELSGTLTENTTMVDIDLDPNMPDYIISGDLTIPNGIILDFDPTSAGGITVKVADNMGIVVEAGGLFRAVSGSQYRLTSDTGWKGILVDGGSIEIGANTTIENAGTSTFAGQVEAAAITLNGVTSNITSMTNAIFQNSGSFDLLVTGPISSGTQDKIVVNNTFSFVVPIKAPIAFVSKVSFNIYPPSYDYLHFVPSGGSTIDALSGSEIFIFPIQTKCFIDGDFLSGSPIKFDNSTILIKEGAGILAQRSLDIINSSTLSGLDGANWKGIAFASSTDQMVINSSTIKNAGSDVFSTGFFSTSVKAAVFYNSENNSGFTNSTIENSGGYGIYVESQSGYVEVTNSTFSGTILSAVRARLDRTNTTVGINNTFTMPAGVAAVEVFVPNATISPVSTWNSLGGSNYYLFSGHVYLSSGSWTLSPGVNLKFKAGKSLNIQQGNFIAIGTATEPITFDSEAGTTATWAGIHVQTTTKFELCQIRNGGEVFIQKNGVTPATEKANVVFDYGGGITSNTFKNNTVSGSGGYGILVESGKQNPDALNVANGNTFSANTSGDVIVK